MPSERFCRAAWWLCWRSSCVSRLGLGGLLCVLTSWAVAQDEGFAWFADGRPNEAAHQALSILLGAAADGLEITRQLRAHFGLPIPAIILSGDTSSATANAAQQAEIPLLHKPVRPAKLRALLQRKTQG